MEEVVSFLEQRLGERYLGLREDRGETTVWIEPSAWVEAARFFKESGFGFLSDLTAVDYLDRVPRFDLSVILLSMATRESVRMKTMLGEEDPRVSTLSELWSGANWFEREVYDLFGIRFDGHPDLRRILLPADYHGHPLRRDYPVTGPPTSVYR
ncbi:MAG: NADH-quinone oxidoreductase subunit C [Armatimonadetes bacterium]|nr:NADH-quinone oxidoreductase subunit C [Armatimonadota bacterium]